jgi:hypothetical protein
MNADSGELVINDMPERLSRRMAVPTFLAVECVCLRNVPFLQRTGYRQLLSHLATADKSVQKLTSR